MRLTQITSDPLARVCAILLQMRERYNPMRNSNFTYMLDAVNIRDHAKHFHELATNAGITRGKILEIGGIKDRRVMSYFKDFDYLNLNLENSQVLSTIIGDITECKAILDDQSFDLIFSKDTFEHIARPQDAAREIVRLLKPGGLCYVVTVFAWRYHPFPADYWRFSPEGLALLFNGLKCIEKNFDTVERRKDVRGSYENNSDAVPVDELGGWRENWRVYYVGVKPVS